MKKYQVMVEVKGYATLEIEATDGADALATAVSSLDQLNLEEDLEEVELVVVDIQTF